MKQKCHPARALVLFCVLFFAGCSQYSSVSEMRPSYRYRPITPIGALLVRTLKRPPASTELLLGRYIEAAAAATRRLSSSPGDLAARRDYNFAVSRIFDVIHDSQLRPWITPVAATGESGGWLLSTRNTIAQARDLAFYDLIAADRYRFHGEYLSQHSIKDGLGAPLIAMSKPNLDLTKLDPFAQGKRIYYGVTAILRFEGRRCVVSIEDPLSFESVKFAGHSFPIAADFTAPIALALASEQPKKLELSRLLDPGKYAHTARVARLQPYDPAKIPVLFVHGLMDSPATWAPMINTLREDPLIRTRYQFWFYSYPSGYPYQYSASIMRGKLDEVNARYTDHKKIVLIGHSMGGMISRTMITDSGMTLWNAVFPTPPEETPLSPEARRILSDALIFKHRPEVGRVVFLSTPHRGSRLASNWIGRLGARLIHAPASLLFIGSEALKLVKLDKTALQLSEFPNSVDTIAPNNRFVKAVNTIPITKGISYHSIIGDRGKGGNRDQTEPVSSDGLVPYWSSHLDGAQSELIVPSNHSTQRNQEAIEEVRRILRLHVKTASNRAP